MTHRCATCDFIGPDQSEESAMGREMHRAFHPTWRLVNDEVKRQWQILQPLIKLLVASETHADTQADYTLAGPSKGDGGGSK